MLPHNHTPEAGDIHMIFIRCKEPLILEDGNRVEYVFSILTSGSQEQLYLSVLQGVGRLIKEKKEALKGCFI